jgi:predicted Zn-dependent protease with MMP-like domain
MACDPIPDSGGWSGRQAPSLGEFTALAETAFAALPEDFRTLAGAVTFIVADFPGNDVLAEMKADTPFDLLGLFEGVGLAHADAVPVSGAMANRVWLYRRPILDYWAEHEETLAAIVTHVLVHEIGHHFGLSDADMEALEEKAG